MIGIWSAAAARSFSRRVAGMATRRGYGAAAVALDYESGWESDDEPAGGRRNPGVPAAAWGEESSRGVQWVFMGSPAAEKHVYATRVAAILGVPYISMGSLIRRELHPGSSLYKMIAGAVNEGKLVPEEIIFGLLSERLDAGRQRGETGFILDGIPRTRIQAEILDQMAEIDLVVNFKCKECLLAKEHHGSSSICTHCRRPFDPSSASTGLNPCLGMPLPRHATIDLPPASSSQLEGSCSEKQLGYPERSKLLEEHYKKRNRLLDFQVVDGPAETWQGLLAALHLQNHASSSHKLTV